MKCNECPLKGCKQVLGYGPVQADVAFVGEAPGYVEVRTGRPFTGPSGTLLAQVLKALNVKPSSFYYTNISKCRDPKRGTPDREVLRACADQLYEELAARGIKTVIALGKIAAQYTGCAMSTMREMHGRWYQYGSMNAIATYNPAALLHSADLFPDFAEDIEKALLHPIPVEGKLLSDDQFIVLDAQEAVVYLDGLMGRVAFDIETSSLKVVDNDLLSIAFADTIDSAKVIPKSILSDPKVRDALRHAFERPTVLWLAHNAQYDVSRVQGILGFAPRISDDTMLLHYVLDERTGTHGLKQLAKKYLNVPDWESSLKKYKTYDAVPPAILYRYNANDAVMNLRLYEHLYPILDTAGSKLLSVYRGLLIPAANALVSLTVGGCLIDESLRQRLMQEALETREHAAAEMRSMLGDPNFNPRSSKQVHDILYLRYKAPDYNNSDPVLENGIPTVTNIKGRAADTTAKDQLQRLVQPQYECAPFVKLLLEARSAQQLVGQYLVNFKPESDGRLHPGLQLHTTVTGRLSGSRPNLMNLTREGPLRGLIIAPPGRILLAADYSQAEVRTVGSLAKSIKLKEIYEAGLDVHDEAGKLLFKNSYVRATHRTVVKGAVFGLIYGRSPSSLSLTNGISLDEAEYITNFILDWLGIREWIVETKALMHKQGYVESVTGRRRHFPLMLPENLGDLERQAINFPVQSAASDMMLISLIRLEAVVADLQASILFPTHDSLLMEVEQGYEAQLARTVSDIMVSVPRAILGDDIPFSVDFDLGYSYDKKSMSPYREWKYCK